MHQPTVVNVTPFVRRPPLRVPTLAPEKDSSQEWLPFSIRQVRTTQELEKAVAIRHRAYARHLPGLAETLRAPESMDEEPGVVVFLATSKVDGSPLGTMRLQNNAHRPLALEQSIALPDDMRARSLVEATRLGVTQERVGRLVKTALFKSAYQYCIHQRVDTMVIAGRAPLDRQYEAMMFRDLYPERGFVPLRHASNIPHRVMYFDVATLEPLWRAAHHPFHDFFFNHFHPDLETDLPGFRAAISRDYAAATVPQPTQHAAQV